MLSKIRHPDYVFTFLKLWNRPKNLIYYRVIGIGNQRNQIQNLAQIVGLLMASVVAVKWVIQLHYPGLN